MHCNMADNHAAKLMKERSPIVLLLTVDNSGKLNTRLSDHSVLIPMCLVNLTFNYSSIKYHLKVWGQ